MEEMQDDSPSLDDGNLDGGVPDEQQESGDSEAQGNANKDDPHGIKKRLGMQAKKHQRELRAMQEQMQRLQEHYSSQNQDQNQYSSPGQPSAPNDSEEEKIQRAVRYALQAKEHEERKAKDAEQQAHVHKQYQRLNNEFDKASDKYDDFEEVVRGDDVPFTPHVRDALLLVDNPADVAYKLGKNRSELERISKLHPIDQAREVNKLSYALMGEGNGKSSSSPKVNPMGSIKANPNTSKAVTDKTSAAEIRQRMRAGTWK